MAAYWRNWDNWSRRDGGEMQWLERLKGHVGPQPGCQRQLDQSRERLPTVFLTLPCQSVMFQTFPHFTGLFVVIVQSLSHVQLFATSWTAAHQVSLSITNSWGLLKLKSIEFVIPSNHLILCCPLLLLPSILPGIRVFPKESVIHIRWPKYWSFSFTIRTDFLWDGLVGSLCSPRDSQEYSPTPQFKSINSSALSFLYSSTLTSIHDYWINQSFE